VIAYYGSCPVCGRLIPARNGFIGETCSSRCAIERQAEVVAVHGQPKAKPKQAKRTGQGSGRGVPRKLYGAQVIADELIGE
jgi:hypothetical protein